MTLAQTPFPVSTSMMTRPTTRPVSASGEAQEAVPHGGLQLKRVRLHSVGW